MWSSLSPTNTLKKKYMSKDSHITSTEHWQKTSDFQKGKKKKKNTPPHDWVRKKEAGGEKRKKRVRMIPALLGGSCERGKESTQWEAP